MCNCLLHADHFWPILKETILLDHRVRCSLHEHVVGVLCSMGFAEILSPLLVGYWSIQRLRGGVLGVSCERGALLLGGVDCLRAWFKAGAELIFALSWYFYVLGLEHGSRLEVSGGGVHAVGN